MSVAGLLLYNIRLVLKANTVFSTKVISTKPSKRQVGFENEEKKSYVSCKTYVIIGNLSFLN